MVMASVIESQPPSASANSAHLPLLLQPETSMADCAMDSRRLPFDARCDAMQLAACQMASMDVRAITERDNRSMLLATLLAVSRIHDGNWTDDAFWDTIAAEVQSSLIGIPVSAPDLKAKFLAHHSAMISKYCNYKQRISCDITLIADECERLMCQIQAANAANRKSRKCWNDETFVLTVLRTVHALGAHKPLRHGRTARMWELVTTTVYQSLPVNHKWTPIKPHRLRAKVLEMLKTVSCDAEGEIDRLLRLLAVESTAAAPSAATDSNNLCIAVTADTLSSVDETNSEHDDQEADGSGRPLLRVPPVNPADCENAYVPVLELNNGPPPEAERFAIHQFFMKDLLRAARANSIHVTGDLNEALGKWGQVAADLYSLPTSKGLAPMTPIQLAALLEERRKAVSAWYPPGTLLQCVGEHDLVGEVDQLMLIMIDESNKFKAQAEHVHVIGNKSSRSHKHRHHHNNKQRMGAIA